MVAIRRRRRRGEWQGLVLAATVAAALLLVAGLDILEVPVCAVAGRGWGWMGMDSGAILM
jgi:hypothetical protein